MTREPSKRGLLAILDDMRQCAAKMSTLSTELAAHIANSSLADDSPVYPCPHCPGHDFHSPRLLAEHLYHQHGGPEPAHWLEAERMAEA